MPPVVEVVDLAKEYGSRGPGPVVTALAGVSLAIERGEIFALLGPNGAGKTTLIGCVAGLVRPTRGSCRVLGRDVIPEYRFTRRAVGLVPQEINFDPFFTVDETLRFQAGYFGVNLADARLVEILDALALAPKRHANTRTLSGGMKRRLLIAKALVHDPPVLFLDEPTAGVDVELRQDLWAYVRQLRDRGTTIVLTTHYLEEAEVLADRVGLIDRGRLLSLSTKAELLRRFGERTLRISLVQPLEALPEVLAARGARLAGGAIEVTNPLHEELGSVLADVVAAGLHVRDVETRRTDLEDIYVKLLRGGQS
ncbi:MAG TPA: ABC transporter ATP-binding protein [Haliangiales bacterium]|nr:ABC transporter ATP-binding protein [Haliangiales bacterium]